MPPSVPPLATGLALQHGLATYVTLPADGSATFGGRHLDGVQDAFQRMTEGGAAPDGVLVAAMRDCAFCIAWIDSFPWIFDPRPCQGLRGDLAQAVIWASFTSFGDALLYLCGRYPANGPWAEATSNSVLLWTPPRVEM